MVVDTSDLGIEALIYAALGVLAGLALAGLAVAALAHALGRRRFGFGSICMGLVVALAAGVDLIVVWRTITGEVTGWDLLWAAGSTLAAAASLRRLAAGRSTAGR